MESWFSSSSSENPIYLFIYIYKFREQNTLKYM